MIGPPPRIDSEVQDDSRRRERSPQSRYFFVLMAVLFVLIVAIGFGPSYGAMVSGDVHPSWYIHVHGAIMLAWVFLFLAQTLLAATGRITFHRLLGLASVPFAMAVWGSMGFISVRRLLLEHPSVDDVGFDVLAIDFYIMAIFAWFVGWGIWARKQPAIHRRLFLLAMIPVLHPAIGRIAWLPSLGITYPHAWYVHVDLLMIPLFLYDWSAQRVIHKVTWFGCGSIIGAQFLALLAWGSPAWHRFWFQLLSPSS
jgi:hypothetical protein